MSRQRIIAGIDIGSSKTTTIISSIGDDDSPKVIGVAAAFSKGIRKGQIVNLEEATQGVVASVEAAERMAGYHLTQALISVSGPQLASQNSTGVVAVAQSEGEITEDDVRRVIEAARAISLPSSREIVHCIPRFFTVDGQEGVKDPLGMSGIRLEVETHIVTASTTAIKNITKCISEMGIEATSLVANSLAGAESVLTETEKELGVILVDFGGGVTSLAVYVEGAPFYTSVLPIGARNVTNDLAIGLRLSLESAEKIKLALAQKKKYPTLPGETKEEKEKDEEINLESLGISDEARNVSRKTLIDGIIKPRLNELFAMIGLEIRKSGAAGLTPSGVVVCGGGAQTIGLVEAAKRTLGMPVRIGYPQGVTGLIDEIETPEFATAVGLVLYGAKREANQPADFGLGKFGGKFGKKIKKFPAKGVASRVINIIKSFLP